MSNIEEARDNLEALEITVDVIMSDILMPVLEDVSGKVFNEIDENIYHSVRELVLFIQDSSRRIAQ